jgi:hypothetical protein
VKVSFSGQEAILDGKVASQADRERAGRVIAERVSVPGLGSSFNPVSNVINRIGPSGEFARQHQQPWLLAILANGGVTIAGVLPSDQERATTLQALKSKLAPPPVVLVDKLTAPAGARAAIDLESTLKNVPDLAAAALANADHAVLVTSTCDGTWSPVSPASIDDGALLAKLSSAQPDTETLFAATAPLRQWQADEARRKLIAALPMPVVTVGLMAESLHAHGMVGDTESRVKLLAALTAAFPKLKVVDHVDVGPTVKPEMDFAKAIADAPKTMNEPLTAFVMKPDTKPAVWDGKGELAALKKALTAEGSNEAIAQLLWDEMTAEKAARTEREAKAKAASAPKPAPTASPPAPQPASPPIATPPTTPAAPAPTNPTPAKP